MEKASLFGMISANLCTACYSCYQVDSYYILAKTLVFSETLVSSWTDAWQAAMMTQVLIWIYTVAQLIRKLSAGCRVSCGWEMVCLDCYIFCNSFFPFNSFFISKISMNVSVSGVFEISLYKQGGAGCPNQKRTALSMRGHHHVTWKVSISL
jgi:uncharacterized membrane protein